MVKRINAFRIVFNFLLSVVELLIGVHFLIELFGSSASIYGLSTTIRGILSEIGNISSNSTASTGSGLENSVTALALILGFMLFSFILMTILPNMVKKKEQELEYIDE